MESERAQFVDRSRRAFTRLARFINQMMREPLAESPLTLQQCYTLEALTEGPMTINELAGEVALHQSTLSRIVEKLEKQGHVTRTRPADNQRKVEVRITDKGKELYLFLNSQCNQMISGLIDLIPVDKQKAIIDSLEEITRLLNPQNREFKQLLSQCCKGPTGILSSMDETQEK
mgnify:CR=1 FL=1